MRLGPSDTPGGPPFAPGKVTFPGQQSPRRPLASKVKSFVVREELAGLTCCYQSVVALTRRLCLVVTSDQARPVCSVSECPPSGVILVVRASWCWFPIVWCCLLCWQGRCLGVFSFSLNDSVHLMKSICDRADITVIPLMEGSQMHGDQRQ